MQKLQNNKGFTLIELLVVITIIGILATGATTVYTSQIQKSRDSVRLTDVKALQSGIEQYYQDFREYPPLGNAFSGITVYTPKLPQDPKSSQASRNSSFDYYYNTSPDENTVIRQEYEVSTHFEQSGNITSKARTDGGNDNFRLEIGIGIEKTNKNTNQTGAKPASLTKYQCTEPAGTSSVPCTANGSTAHAMLIRN